MLYNLLVPWASEWTALNVFRYITFRSMAALITALVLSILLGPSPGCAASNAASTSCMK